MFKSQYLILISAIFVAVLIGWLLIIPKISAIEKANGRKEMENGELAVVRQTQAAVEDSITFFDSLSEQDLELLELAAPNDPDTHNLAVLMNRLVVESGLLLRDMNIEDDDVKNADGAPLGTIPLSITATGTYENFKLFLAKAEQTLRLFDISRIDVGQDTGIEDAEQFVFNVRGFAYYTK
ncbi:MAG: hypothetical protein A2932_00480 [Candidatus Spechtbacteria bacterium RIFCSPLOWO2_01_FULL_46_10]|uniref:Pilus assembly protein PilO n=1 Tax=Candidatus Spechtbacteria bacterium RIFCSPLOWO2_01_FULL_46_10 TaxID=1802163 RepID=A0A1G2HGV1_9BACT|nr:MAG: hypothetical protein A2932_00480 [Candidatus Spechtbacteria bacterium RIFCSPLOWO2_01_FULL_46_10]